MKFILILLPLFFSYGAFAQEQEKELPALPNTTNTLTPVAKPDPDSAKRGRAISFYIENDSKNLGGPGSDDAYSNGFKWAYTYAEDQVPSWAGPLTDWSDMLHDRLLKPRTNYGISVAQQIYTPNNTQTDQLITDDRPYAAWLYLGFTTNFRSEYISHTLELDAGMVGPTAGGKYIQNGFHHIIGDASVKGWANQLHDEPTLELSYQQKLRVFQLKENERTYFDAIPFYGLAVGNVLDAAHLGGLVRFGYNLPDDFGPSRPSSLGGDTYSNPSMDLTGTNSYSLYGFISGQANAIARNIFLDGNTFQSSAHVTKYPLTLENEIGFGAQWRHWSGVWRFVTRSPEFEEKKQINSFASVSITYSW